MWLRPGNRLLFASGTSETSSTNVGARVFAVNTDRVEIAGGLVSGRLPYAAILRYLNAVLFYLSELTSQQVYLNESSLTGVTTSATSGGLRLAVPAGGGTYSVYDAGFNPPVLPSGDVSTSSGGTKSMQGNTGVSLSAWRTTTNAISAPSNVVYKVMTPGTADIFSITLPAAVFGQDGWILGGTRWGDASGDVRVVRYVYITPRGTFTATNGSPNISGDSSTRWLRDLYPGDTVVIGGGTYTIATITADNAATITPNFTGTTGSGKTALLIGISSDWLNGELGDLINRNAFKPPPAAGVFQFAGNVFLWGTYGASGSVTGPAITPMLKNNPEHVGLVNILTTYGNDLVNVIPGDQTLFLMTTNTLETVTFTGNDTEPYKIRAYDGLAGFRSPKNGVVYKNRFYGYSQRPFRTVTDSDIDVEFAQAVADSMVTWDGSKVVVMFDPQKEAVLYCHFVAAIPPATEGITTCIPYMAQIDKWGPPIEITGQITDAAISNGQLYVTIVTSSGNYRVNTWEGGTGLADPYIDTQFINYPDRYRVKGFVFTGRADALTAFGSSPSGPSTSFYPLTLGPGTNAYEEVFANLPPSRALAMRISFTAGAGFMDRLIARGYRLAARR